MYNLQVYNFQRFKNQSMQIQGFTVLEGQSNLGKSSIRRAIGVVTQNLWEANFVSKGSKNTVINLEADDIKIQCTKGTSNEFIVLKGKDRAEYKKAGKDIPKEIIASGFSPLVIGKEKINLLMAKQYDPLFMVSYSDQQNTKILNTVFDVDVIEKANELVIKDIASQKRELKRELQFSQDKQAELDITSLELRKFQELKSIYEKISLIDNYKKGTTLLDEALNNLKLAEVRLSNVNRLISLNKSYRQAELLQEKLREYKSLQKQLNILTSKIQLISVNDKLLLLEDLEEVNKESFINVDEYLYIQEDLNTIDRAIKIYSNLSLMDEYDEVHNSLLNVNKKLEDINTFNKLMRSFSTLQLLDKIPFIKWRIKGNKDEQDSVNSSIALCDKDIKAIGICPCCGNDLY